MNDTGEEGVVKMGGNTKGSKQALVRVVWSQPSRRQYSVEIKDQVCQEMWKVEWLFWSSSASELFSKAWRNSDIISFYVVPPEELRRKRKIWILLKNRCGIRDTSPVFATHVEEDLNEHGLQKDALVPLWYWKATLRTCSVYWRDGFIPAISGVRANNFEQLMRETFRVRACERVDPGFLTTVEILRRNVAWNVELLLD